MLSFYDVNDIDVSHPLISQYFAEGIFGADVVKHGENVNIRYFSESRRVPFPPSSVLETFQYTNVYQVLPARATCFTFSFSRSFPFQKIRKIPGNAWIQILARRRDERWRDMVAAQYDAHLNGVKNPSSFSLLRRAQEWMAEKMHEAAGWAEGGVVIPESEQKEEEDGFQVSIRIAVQGERKQHKHILPFLEALFKPLANVNEFKVESSSKALLSNMEARTFAVDDKKSFILCTSELKTFFPEPSEPVCEEEELVDVKVEESSAMDESLTDPYAHLPEWTKPIPGKVITTGKSVKPVSDIETEQTKRKIEKALRKVGLLTEQRLEIVDITKGPTMQQVLIRLPKGTTMNTLAKHQKNMQAELGVEEVTITQGKQPGTAALLFIRDVRETIWLEPILNSEAFKTYAKKHDLPFVAGVDIAGKPIFESLVRLKHIISAGTTGGGKTEFLVALLYSLLSSHSPTDLHIYGIDPKRIALSHFRPFPHVKDILTDMEEAVELLQTITEEMERRYQLMEEVGVESIQEYCEETGEKIPYIVIVIDEYADLSMVNALVEHFIIRLGQLARQAGIHVVLATQRPAADILTSKIKTNLLSRFCFLCASPGDYQTVFGKQMSPALMGQGDGLCVREGIPGMTRFQAPLLASSSKEKKAKLEALRAEWVQEKASSDEEIDKLATFITDTGETRIREIQKFAGVRTAKAQEMMQQLVVKGILLPPDDTHPRYRLVSDNENNIV